MTVLDHYHRVVRRVLIIALAYSYFLKAVCIIQRSCGRIFAPDLKKNGLHSRSVLGFERVRKQAVADASLTLVLSYGNAIYLAFGRDLSSCNISHHSAFVGGG